MSARTQRRRERGAGAKPNRFESLVDGDSDSGGPPVVPLNQRICIAHPNLLDEGTFDSAVSTRSADVMVQELGVDGSVIDLLDDSLIQNMKFAEVRAPVVYGPQGVYI